MADIIHTFEENKDILASQVNDNFQAILSRLNDNAAQVQNYVETQLGSIQSTISSMQATLQSNINTLSAEINKIKAADPVIISNSNGKAFKYKGFIIQWGRIYDDPKKTKYGTYTQNLPTPFTNIDYSIAISSNYLQTAGDKGATMQIYPNNTTSFKYSPRYEQQRGSYTFWIAVGN